MFALRRRATTTACWNIRSIPGRQLGEEGASLDVYKRQACLLVVEAGQKISPADIDLIAKFRSLGMPAVLALNKIDLVPHEKLLLLMNQLQEYSFIQEILPISARTGEGLEELERLLAACLPEGPKMCIRDSIYLLDRTEAGFQWIFSHLAPDVVMIGTGKHEYYTCL